ncbi:haloacid dehalogenase-like hydrolase domain-containing protein 2 [Styela clava]
MIMAARIALGHVQAVLVDLSGTLHIGNIATLGAVEALSKLQNSHLKVKFVTNTTKESVSSLHNRLLNIGFNIDKSEIYSSLTAVRNYLIENKYKPFLMLSDDAEKDFVGLEMENPNAVVMGLSPTHFQYDMMNTAFHLLMNGCPLIAINKARYYQATEGLLLGTGAFVEALEYASGTKAVVIGKPDKTFFLGAAKSIGCEPEKCVMIGDDVRDDVLGAINSGMQGILVKTGKYREGDEQNISQSLSNFIVSNNFSDAVDIILKTISSR